MCYGYLAYVVKMSLNADDVTEERSQDDDAANALAGSEQCGERLLVNRIKDQTRLVY